MENEFKSSGNTIFWTEERCFVAAKSCEKIKEFSTKYPTAYVRSIEKGWRKNYTWLKRSVEIDMVTPNYMIYVYEDKSEKICYVGLTNNLIKRKSQHKKTRYYKNRQGVKYYYRDVVNKYFFENGKELPEPKILESGLTATQAQYKERYWCDFYKNKGWNLLNKAKTGINSSSLGGCQAKWTYEALKEEASKYKTKQEFNKMKNSAYKIARENGYLEEFFPSGFEDLPNEKWRSIDGYENLYQISNFKRVKHLKDNNHKCERLIAIFTEHNIKCVSLYKNNKAKIFSINKLYKKIWEI